MDLSKNVKAWAKNTQFVKNWKLKVDTNKVEKAKKLYNQGASYHAYLKAKITPEQLYKAFDLKEDMRLALKYYGNWGRLHRNPKYTFWRTYDGIWMNAKNKKM
ncbi:putative RxLR effector [Phytophthora cinnamomi]|uniref:putative RxLR effector n=1 Tax=Phytophthora cinnamomi TaxID=4785 RepID=UPI00355A8D6E|nr:putative RxLR effector [Phytophthora cinnamomi]